MRWIIAGLLEFGDPVDGTADWKFGTGPPTEPVAQISGSDLAFVLKDFGPVTDQTVKRLLGRSCPGNYVVVHAFLHWQQKVSISRFCPEVLHDGHAVEESLRVGLTGGKTGILDHCTQGRVAAKFPPLGLDRGLRKPLDVF